MLPSWSPIGLWACSCCIKLRICRLWLAEWGGTSDPHRVSEFPLWGGKNPASFWLKAQLTVCSHKGSKVTRLLFTNPRNRDGERGGTECQEKGSLLSQVTSEQKTEMGRKPLLLIRWLGQRSLIYWTQLKVDFLKWCSGKRKWELGAGILI